DSARRAARCEDQLFADADRARGPGFVHASAADAAADERHDSRAGGERQGENFAAAFDRLLSDAPVLDLAAERARGGGFVRADEFHAGPGFFAVLPALGCTVRPVTSDASRGGRGGLFPAADFAADRDARG